jgi:hypothetical protein
MSQLSFKISPKHGESQGRDESLPTLAQKSTLKEREIYIQVIPQEGEIIWTTGQFIQPR